MRYSGFGAALVAALAVTSPLSAQQPARPPVRPGPPPAEMKMHMQMMDSMSARLDSAAARMNRSTGEARTAAMADVLNALVAEHRMMHMHMQEMMGGHMGGMPGMAHPAPGQPMHGMMHSDSGHAMPGMARPDSARRPPRK